MVTVDTGELLAEYDRAMAELRRAAREYHRLHIVWRAKREQVLRALSGSQWDVSVVLNETAHGCALSPEVDDGGATRAADVDRQTAPAGRH